MTYLPEAAIRAFLDSRAGPMGGTSLTVRLDEGDVAWRPGYLDVRGPLVVDYALMRDGGVEFRIVPALPVERVLHLVDGQV